MVTRADLLVLGITASVVGGLVGGILLFTGMNLIMDGRNAGWLLLLITGPACGLIGWHLGRKLGKKTQ
jgi:hypothetical protein